MKRLFAVAAFIVCPLLAELPQARADPALSVCLQQTDPPLSLRAGSAPSGFDLALARAVAQHLNRDLHIQWFVSRDDPDASLPKDANALLSDGRCQLVAEYPLTDSALAPPRSPTAKLPPFDGARADDRNRWVKLSVLAATRPYRLDALAVVLSPQQAGRSLHGLRDLGHARIGVQIATLADAIAMTYGGGLLANQIVHVPDSRTLFDKLQDGQLDAAFADLRAFDAWRLEHRGSNLTVTAYRHSVAFNMGYVGLASDPSLIGQVNAALADMQKRDALAPVATAAGLTFMPPNPPDVRPDVPPAALTGD